VANQITDNRTPVSSADSSTGWTLADGTTATTTDVDTYVQGSGSQTFNLSNTITGQLYNIGSTVDLTGNHIYVWYNCGIAGKLDTKAGGGIRVRFTGPTASNYVEINVGGSDTYSGGWVMFVVDVDAAFASPSATGGTPPAKTAVQRIGVISDTAGFMSKKQDNCWVDAIWRLPANTPGIIVEGRNGGSTDWMFSDILSAATSGGWGTCRQTAGGTIVFNTPVQFGINDATTHGFADSNARIEWDDQPVAATLYGFTVVGGSGAQGFSIGVKSGTGDDATGAQGAVVGAKSTGVRWFFDADDANVDSVGLYGCRFIHGGDFQLDNANVETVNCVFLDCTSATVSNSRFQRCSVIDADTADNVAFCFTDDLSDLRYCSFEFSDGHGVELVTPRVASQASKGNRFAGYGTTGSNDAAVSNESGGAVAISTTSGASVAEHTYQNGSGASTTVTGSVSITISPLATGSECRAYLTGTATEVSGTESSTGSSHVLTLTSGVAVDIRIHNYSPVPYTPVEIINKAFTVDQTVDPVQRKERGYLNP